MKKIVDFRAVSGINPEAAFFLAFLVRQKCVILFEKIGWIMNPENGKWKILSLFVEKKHVRVDKLWEKWIKTCFFVDNLL